MDDTGYVLLSINHYIRILGLRAGYCLVAHAHGLESRNVAKRKTTPGSSNRTQVRGPVRNQPSRETQTSGKLSQADLTAGEIAQALNNALAETIAGALVALNNFPPGHPASDVLDAVIAASERASDWTRCIIESTAARVRVLDTPSPRNQ